MSERLAKDGPLVNGRSRPMTRVATLVGISDVRFATSWLAESLESLESLRRRTVLSSWL